MHCFQPNRLHSTVASDSNKHQQSIKSTHSIDDDSSCWKKKEEDEEAKEKKTKQREPEREIIRSEKAHHTTRRASRSIRHFEQIKKNASNAWVEFTRFLFLSFFMRESQWRIPKKNLSTYRKRDAKKNAAFLYTHTQSIIIRFSLDGERERMSKTR